MQAHIQTHAIYEIDNLTIIYAAQSIMFVLLSFPQPTLTHVKQSRYRPGQAQRGLRKLRFPDFVTTAQDGGKVVSLTHRPSLPTGNAPGTHFC
jgi:hypothetical protein